MTPNSYAARFADLSHAMRLQAFDSNTPLSQKRVLLNAADELTMFSVRLTKDLFAALHPAKEATR